MTVGWGMVRCSLILSAVAAVALSACASGPQVVTTPPMAFPATATTYRLIEPDPASATDQAVLSAVRAKLAERGWHETREAPVWLIEAAYAVRSQRTGTYSDVSARRGDWLDAPVLPQWWARKRRTYSLTLTLNGPGGAPGAYHASAATTVAEQKDDAVLNALASAVVADLKPAP